MSARVYFMKREKDCKDESIMSSSARYKVKTDKFTLFDIFVYCNFLVVLSTILFAVKTKTNKM